MYAINILLNRKTRATITARDAQELATILDRLFDELGPDFEIEVSRW